MLSSKVTWSAVTVVLSSNVSSFSDLSWMTCYRDIGKQLLYIKTHHYFIISYGLWWDHLREVSGVLHKWGCVVHEGGYDGCYELGQAVGWRPNGRNNWSEWVVSFMGLWQTIEARCSAQGKFQSVKQRFVNAFLLLQVREDFGHYLECWILGSRWVIAAVHCISGGIHSSLRITTVALPLSAFKITILSLFFRLVMALRCGAVMLVSGLGVFRKRLQICFDLVRRLWGELVPGKGLPPLRCGPRIGPPFVLVQS